MNLGIHLSGFTIAKFFSRNLNELGKFVDGGVLIYENIVENLHIKMAIMEVLIWMA